MKSHFVYDKGLLVFVKGQWLKDGTELQSGDFIEGTGGVVLYYEDGSLFKELRYTEGKLNGEVKFYHQSEQLSEIGEYKQGVKTGYWKCFDENGKLLSVGKYVNGEKKGVWKFFDVVTGKVKETKLF